MQKKNLDTRRILRSAIDDHQKLLLKKEDCLDPPKIPSFGKPEFYPSRNVDIIKRKSKKVNLNNNNFYKMINIINFNKIIKILFNISILMYY